MDRLKAMTVFVRVVETRSFSKAAEVLDLPRSAVTATIQRLEAHLGARLLQRTTRRVAPTAEGEEYYLGCLDVLAAADSIDESVSGRSDREVRGTLRVDLPGALARAVIVPRLQEFRTAHPALKMMVGLADRVSDLIQEGVDCAVRVGHLHDSSLVARPIGSMTFVTCAAPGYLAERGTPRTIGELAGHDLVMHYSGRTGRAFDWDFVVDGKVVNVPASGSLGVNDADANVLCGLHGCGLIQAASYQVREHIAHGRLVEVLSAWKPAPLPVSLLYPQRRLVPRKVRLFAQWVQAVFAAHPDLN